jgi:alpha-L-fucosidase
MYTEGSPQYKFHLATYGHPSRFGFKDVIGTWKGDRFDADYLIGLYKKAGAKYFVSMGVHHDNFDMWNSKFQPRWNAAKMGPKKDIVGLFSAAARNNGLKFGVSEHLWISYKWFAVNHGAEFPTMESTRRMPICTTTTPASTTRSSSPSSTGTTMTFQTGGSCIGSIA